MTAEAAPGLYERVEVGDVLGAIEYEVTGDSVAALRSVAGSDRDLSMTIASKDYAHLLWSIFPQEAAINAGHESVYFRVPEAGETIATTGCIVDKSLRRGRGLIVVETRSFVARTGDPVALSRTQLLLARVEPDDGTGRPAGSSSSHTPPSPEEEILPGVEKLLTDDDFIEFERVSKTLMGADPTAKNLHSDPALAQAAGLRRPIGSGMITVALLTETLSRHYGEAWWRGGRISVKFVKPIEGGDTVRTVAHARRIAGANGVEHAVRLECLNQRDERISVGWAHATTRG